MTISHEWGPTVKTIHILRKPSVWIYTKTFGFLSDGILPISEYIIKRIKHFKRPYLKVPILADFDECEDQHNIEDKDKFFLYCVYAAYTRVVYKIIDAYVQYIKDGGNYQLKLVLSGDEGQINVIRKYINEKRMDFEIKILTKLPYRELQIYYKKASALIIPLDPNSEQDKARFSQKIAEYLSSCSPVISNDVGEISFYFKDKENIFLCDYSIKGFNDIFKWISCHEREAKSVGMNGFKLGKEEFNYKLFGKEIHDFISTI